MKVLVTGGAGFIGSQLVAFLLKKKYEVLVFDNLSWGRKEFLKPFEDNPNFKFVKLDLLDLKTLEKALPSDIDTVFHLAANSDIMRGGDNPIIDFENTTIATFNLLSAMRTKGVKKIFYFSGSGVYGDVGSTYTSESFGPLLPISMYGATKLSSEAMISAYTNLFDMQAWILRPANIIGQNSTHGVVLDFINKLQKDPAKLEIWGDGTQSKSYLYIDDVIDAVYLVWKKAKNRVNLFNISSNSFITVSEIAEAVVKGMKLKNVDIIYTGGNRGWKGDVPVVRISNGALKKIGWKCNYTSKQAVKKTIEVLISS